MDDYAEIVLVISLVLAFDMLLLAFFVISTMFPTRSHGQSHTAEWKKVQTQAGWFFCTCELTAATCGAVYLRTLTAWVVDFCPSMSTPEDCNEAAKTWGNLCWWFILPMLFAATMICSSLPRARTTLIYHPEQLYYLKDHVVSIAMFQVSLYFSLPLAYPLLFFRNVADRPNWIIVSIICGSFMIMAYGLGIAYWIEGSAKLWIQPRPRTPRSTVPQGEIILLTNISNRQQD